MGIHSYNAKHAGSTCGPPAKHLFVCELHAGKRGESLQWESKQASAATPELKARPCTCALLALMTLPGLRLWHSLS